MNYASTLANWYLYGSRLVDYDPEEAGYYFRIATEGGHVRSSGQLGILIAQGHLDGTEKEALTLLQYAMDNNDANGYLGMAYCHFKGFGMPQNVTRAYELFRAISGPEEYFKGIPIPTVDISAQIMY